MSFKDLSWKLQKRTKTSSKKTHDPILYSPLGNNKKIAEAKKARCSGVFFSVALPLATHLSHLSHRLLEKDGKQTELLKGEK